MSYETERRNALLNEALGKLAQVHGVVSAMGELGFLDSCEVIGVQGGVEFARDKLFDIEEEWEEEEAT